jgi:hypothetical protein
VVDSDNSGAESVTLDGSGSSDSDGTIVSYAWREDGSPIASGVNPIVDFAVGVHTVTLRVTDNDGSTDTDTVVITVEEGPNVAPVADAGADQTVVDSDDNGVEAVTLDGSGSSDSDGTIISYVWREDGSPIASGVNPIVDFAVGTHTVTLEVIDDDGATDSDTVVITVEPAPNVGPTADAGADQTVVDSDDSGMEAVTLDGSRSFDSDGTIVSYVWRVGDSQIATGVNPTADFAVGVHTVTLEVIDDDEASDTDTVIIAVSAVDRDIYLPIVINLR